MITIINGKIYGTNVRDYSILFKDHVDINDIVTALKSLRFPYCVTVESDDGKPKIVKIYSNRVFYNGSPKEFMMITYDYAKDKAIASVLPFAGGEPSIFEKFTNSTVLGYIKSYYDEAGFKCDASKYYRNKERQDMLSELISERRIHSYTLEEIADALSEHNIESSITVKQAANYSPDDNLAFRLIYNSKIIRNGHLLLVRDDESSNKYFLSIVIKDKLHLFYKSIENFISAIEKGDFSENVVASYVE